MSDETPWGRFPDRSQHPDFAAAYGRLHADPRKAADIAIANAADQMHGLLGHPLLKPMGWPGLAPKTARLVDMAERTCMAMGVFRLSIAGRLGTGRTALSDGLDRAADQVDRRAVELALRALEQGYPHLAKIRPGDSAAYHHLLNHLVRSFEAHAFEVAQCQSEQSAELDLTLETGLKHGVLISIVVHQEKIREAVRQQTGKALAGSMPLEPAVALWLLASMGLGRLFGEDDKTLAYAD